MSDLVGNPTKTGFLTTLFICQNNNHTSHIKPLIIESHFQDGLVESFYLSNVVPHNLENNAGFWNRFEMYCRDLTKKYSSVYIISGPLVLPQLDETGKKFVKYQVYCFHVRTSDRQCVCNVLFL